MANNTLTAKTTSSEFNLNVNEEKKKSKVKTVVVKSITYIFLTIVAIFSFLPFYWMVISSLKTEKEYRASVPSFFPSFPIDAKNNYTFLFESAKTSDFPITDALINTLLVAVISTILGLIIIIISAYAFARLEFKGKDFVFSLMMLTMMIPGELFTTTNFITVGQLGWNGTYVVLIVPFLVSFYYIFLLRNAFKQIPDSLYQAAKVDGCSDLGYLIKVMVPLTAPTLTSVALLKFIGIWNTYIWPRLVNKKDVSMQLISNWVMQGFADSKGFFKGVEGYMYGSGEPLGSAKMAAVCLVTLPLVILFICFRKYIMTGVSKSGTKG